MRNELWATEELVGCPLEDVRLREEHYPLVGVVGDTHTGKDRVLDFLERFHRKRLGEVLEELFREVRGGRSDE